MLISDHECPNCKTTLGSLKQLFSDGTAGEVPEGKQIESHSLCIVCGAFLKVLEFKAGRAQVRMLDAEEILAMADSERIALQRLQRSVKKVPPAALKDAIERFNKNKQIFQKVRKDLAVMIDTEVEKHFGNEVGVMLILKDLEPMGFQGVLSNIPEELLLSVLRRATAEYSGEIPDILKRALLGEEG